MAVKRLPDDFKDFLSLLNRNGVRYLLVGGWAVGVYGHPRATADMSILIAVDETNLTSLTKALREFGTPPVDAEQFKKPGQVFRMGRSPIRIDIINQASGIDVDDCYTRRMVIQVDGEDISLISRQDLIRNKRAAGREKDMADVRVLENTD